MMAEMGEKTPLDMLARLKARDGSSFLTHEAFSAGERLAEDFTRALMQPRVSASLEPRLEARGRGHSGAASAVSDTAIDARSRVARALKAIGPELADIALDFCCFMKGLEQIERERQWPVRSAKLMVRTALLALARHYAPPPAKTGIRGWGAEGYRPEISAFFTDD
ncbi:DUF6456 domain-containing protein [Martelella soudanensis]|uniref:DUF6456 domain-containing protein n=1 Tax=unclassified Martelella TaxID=2629616 RepID=UPI0015DEB18B|nr:MULTISPECIES: DUF6456 domain-containing protein [unclassified Martelella]